MESNRPNTKQEDIAAAQYYYETGLVREDYMQRIYKQGFSTATSVEEVIRLSLRLDCMNVPKEIQELIDALTKIGVVGIDRPTNDDGDYFLDVFTNNKCVCVQASRKYIQGEDVVVSLGFSIIDDDTGYGDRPDCICGNIETLVKYVKLLLDN